MSILQNCFALNLQVGTWMGYKLDKNTTRKVVNDAGAASDAMRVNKHLIAKDVISPIQTARGALRLHFYKVTLPWKDNGDRLIPRQAYHEKFISEHGALREKFDQEVEVFFNTGYPRALEQAEFRMGSAFDPEDYPRESQLRKCFYVNLDIDAVSATYDWRLEKDASVLQGRVNKAIGGLWQKLAEPLERFANALEGGSEEREATVKKATVNNLREIVETLPLLNFTNDPELNKIKKQIEERITRYEPEDLRGKDKSETRAVVSAEAREILDQMQGFMRAMGSNGDE